MKEYVIIMNDGETVRLKASSMLKAVEQMPSELSEQNVVAVMRVEDYEALDVYKSTRR